MGICLNHRKDAGLESHWLLMTCVLLVMLTSSYVMLCYVIQLTPRWGFSAADYIK